MQDQLTDREGYDAVIIQHKKGDIVVVKNANQIKSADDNIGTFDSGEDDVRYSLSVTRDDFDRLKRENEKLKHIADELKHEIQLTGGRELDSSKAYHIAKYLKKELNTTLKVVELRDMLLNMHRNIQNFSDYAGLIIIKGLIFLR